MKKKPKKNQIKVHILKDEIYHQDISVVVNVSMEEMNKYIYKNYSAPDCVKPQFDGEHFELRSVVDHHKKHFIWLEKFDWTIADQARVVHELLHCVGCVMNDMVIKYDSDTGDHAFIYYFDYLFKQIWHKLKPKK